MSQLMFTTPEGSNVQSNLTFATQPSTTLSIAKTQAQESLESLFETALQACEAAAKEKNNAFQLFNLGKQLAESIQFPADILSLSEALSFLNKQYNCRSNSDFADARLYFEVLENNPQRREIRVLCTNQYATEIDKGLLTVMIKKFKPKEAKFFHVEHYTRLYNPQPSTTNQHIYLISWL